MRSWPPYTSRSEPPHLGVPVGSRPESPAPGYRPCWQDVALVLIIAFLIFAAVSALVDDPVLPPQLPPPAYVTDPPATLEVQP